MFAKDKVSQSMIDAVNKVIGLTEAKVEPDAPDSEAIARRKRLQAIRDKQEDERAERGSEKKTSNVRNIKGTYGTSHKDDDLDEEVEELDELSKNTLKSYAKKASSSDDERSASNLSSKASYKLGKSHEADIYGMKSSEGDDDGEKDDRKSVQRSKGIGRAIDRLAKEGVELDEAEEFTHGTTSLQYGHNHPNVAKELHKHAGKIQSIHHNTHDDALAAIVNGDNNESGAHKGEHQVHYFLNNKKVLTTIHPTYRDAHAHSVKTITTKAGLKSLNKAHSLVNEATRVADVQGGYNLKKGTGSNSVADRKDAASVVKGFRKTWRNKGLSTKHHATDASMEKTTGFGVTKEETLDEISAGLVSRYSDKASKEYNDPKTPEHKKSTRRAGLMIGYNKAKGRARVPATYEEVHREGVTFADRLVNRARLSESRGPLAGPGETFTDNNIGEMSDAQTKKKEKIVLSMKDKESDFKAKYGKNWKDVMYATATKLAMAEDYELTEKKHSDEEEDEKLIKKMVKKDCIKTEETMQTTLNRVKNLAKEAVKQLTKDSMFGEESEENDND